MKTLNELKKESAGFLTEYREQQRKHQEAIQNAKSEAERSKLWFEKDFSFFTREAHNAFVESVNQACRAEEKEIIAKMSDTVKEYRELCKELDEKRLLSLAISRDLSALNAQKDLVGRKLVSACCPSVPFAIPASVQTNIKQYSR